VKCRLERPKVLRGVNSLEQVRQREKGKVQERELPEVPLLLARRRLVDLGFQVGLGFEVSPSTEVLLYHN
jgi:hypothetical protein